MKRLAMSVPATLDLAPARGRAAARPEVEWVTDLVARAVIVVLFSMMAIRFGQDFLSTGRMTGLLLLVSETLVVVLTVMRRSAVTVDRSTRARLLTTLSVWDRRCCSRPMSRRSFRNRGPSRPRGRPRDRDRGKITLGRSFGLMPANRGVVSSGLSDRAASDLSRLSHHAVAFLVATPVRLEHRRASCGRRGASGARGLRRADARA